MHIAITKEGRVHLISQNFTKEEFGVPGLAVWLENVAEISCFYQTKGNDLTFIRFKHPESGWFIMTYNRIKDSFAAQPLGRE